MHPVQTIALNFEDPFIFDAHAIRRHKTFMCHLPYLLFVDVQKFFASWLSPFFARNIVRMIPGFIEYSRLFRCWLGVIGNHGMLALSLYKACSFFVVWTTLALIVVLDFALILSSISSSKTIFCHFFMSVSLLESKLLLLFLLIIGTISSFSSSSHPS